MVFTLLINMIILINATIIIIFCIQAMRELDVKICALRVILAKIVTRFRTFFLVLIVTHINRGPCYDYQTFWKISVPRFESCIRLCDQALKVKSNLKLIIVARPAGAKRRTTCAIPPWVASVNLGFKVTTFFVKTILWTWEKLKAIEQNSLSFSKNLKRLNSHQEPIAHHRCRQLLRTIQIQASQWIWGSA